jgi:hypothetical protein
MQMSDTSELPIPADAPTYSTDQEHLAYGNVGVMPPAPIASAKGNVGDKTQPTAAEWKEEIYADLRSALAKIAMLPASDQGSMVRLKQIIEVTLTT